MIRAALLEDRRDGIPASDPYVRRFWTAVLGPGAVVALLRLIRAARRRTPITAPDHLADLLRTGLIAQHAGLVWLTESVPVVPPHLVRTMPPFLRGEHSRWIATRSDTL